MLRPIMRLRVGGFRSQHSYRCARLCWTTSVGSRTSKSVATNKPLSFFSRRSCPTYGNHLGGHPRALSSCSSSWASRSPISVSSTLPGTGRFLSPTRFGETVDNLYRPSTTALSLLLRRGYRTAARNQLAYRKSRHKDVKKLAARQRELERGQVTRDTSAEWWNATSGMMKRLLTSHDFRLRRKNRHQLSTTSNAGWDCCLHIFETAREQQVPIPTEILTQFSGIAVKQHAWHQCLSVLTAVRDTIESRPQAWNFSESEALLLMEFLRGNLEACRRTRQWGIALELLPTVESLYDKTKGT